MAGSDSFSFRNQKIYRETALSVGRVGPWRLLPGIARLEVSLKWKELFGERLVQHGGAEDAEEEGRELRGQSRGRENGFARGGNDDSEQCRLSLRESNAFTPPSRSETGDSTPPSRSETSDSPHLSRSERRLWGPETFPEYLRLIDPDDRGRIAGGALRAFLLGKTKNWQATFRRNGLLILARAKAVSPGHVIGVDIDVTALVAGSS